MSEAIVVPKQKINLKRLIIPVGISLGVSLYLFYTNFHPSALRLIHPSQKMFLGLFLGLVAIAVRDFAFMYKIRLSTGEKLSWRRTFQAIIMWEFGAAITPKLGEVAFILWVLKKSGLSYGRSIAALVLNTFLDNVAFVVVFALLYWKLGQQMLIINADCPDIAGHAIMQSLRGLASKAWIGYVFFCAMALFFGVALFWLPRSAKKFFHRVSTIKLFSRFKDSLMHLGDEIEITALEYKGREFSFWFKMSIATLINWAARYLLANALLFAFSTGGLNMLEIFARQYVLWLFLVIPSTPGASGLAELSFIAVNCEFMPVGLSAAIVLVWRIYSYYLYLLLGILVLPKWLSDSKKSNAVAAL